MYQSNDKAEVLHESVLGKTHRWLEFQVCELNKPAFLYTLVFAY